MGSDTDMNQKKIEVWAQPFTLAYISVYKTFVLNYVHWVDLVYMEQNLLLYIHICTWVLKYLCIYVG